MSCIVVVFLDSTDLLLDRRQEAGGDPSGRRGMNAIDTACALGATRALRALLDLPPANGALRTV